MGRGDKKTAKGKRFKGSFGNTRPQKVETKVVAAKPKKEKVAKAPKKVAAEKVEKPKKAPAKKKKEEDATEE
jgi:ribosomal small subunit protein bTHX